MKILIIGFLQVFNEVNWIAYSIEYAMKFCDKLIIVKGSQFANLKEVPVHSNDGTLEIIKKKMRICENRIELVKTKRKLSNYRKNKAEIFNMVLKKCKIGDYLLPLDADEFYIDDFIEKIKNLIE